MDRLLPHERVLRVTADDFESIILALHKLAEAAVTPAVSDRMRLAAGVQALVQMIAAAHDLDGVL